MIPCIYTHRILRVFLSFKIISLAPRITASGAGRCFWPCKPRTNLVSLMVRVRVRRLPIRHCTNGKDAMLLFFRGSWAPFLKRFSPESYTATRHPRSGQIWKKDSTKFVDLEFFSLQRDIVHLSQGSSTISVYFSMIKRLWDEYHSLVTLPSCECDSSRAYLEHEEQQRLIQFLMGLNDNYCHVRSHILMMNPFPSVNKAYSIIVHEESNRQVLAA